MCFAKQKYNPCCSISVQSSSLSDQGHVTNPYLYKRKGVSTKIWGIKVDGKEALTAAWCRCSKVVMVVSLGVALPVGCGATKYNQAR